MNRDAFKSGFWGAVCALTLWSIITATFTPFYEHHAFAQNTPNASGNAATPFRSYASQCAVTVAGPSTTPQSVFCPVATDPQSVIKRTIPAGTALPGKWYHISGGGGYSARTGNATITATISIQFGSVQMGTLTTGAAPAGTNQGLTMFADCIVLQSGTQMSCQGLFGFVILGGTTTVWYSFLGTPVTFNPNVDNMFDVLGNWNTGAAASETTTVYVATVQLMN